MLDILGEWNAQVKDVGEMITQVVSVRVLSPFSLVATVLLSPKVNPDVEPTCIYFDSNKGFAFLNDTSFDEEEATEVPEAVIQRLVFADYLESLIQSTPKGAEAFADALASALDNLARQEKGDQRNTASR